MDELLDGCEKTSGYCITKLYRENELPLEELPINKIISQYKF